MLCSEIKAKELCVRKVLNLHGEVLESLAPAGTTLEEAFLPTLKTLHDQFPQLRIVVRIPESLLYSFTRLTDALFPA